jgi:flagellar export protein FliJ
MSDFRYGRLIEVKEKLLDHKKKELDGASTALKVVVEEIAKVEDEVAQTYGHLTGRCITGNDLSVLTGYLAYLDKRKDSLASEKIEREKRVTTLRQELLNLEIERRMLEKLKFKTLQTIKKARNKKDQKLMDELALRADGR